MEKERSKLMRKVDALWEQVPMELKNLVGEIVDTEFELEKLCNI
jgi:hypothetical protein